ncbi:unnamed protein product [Dovyalis caffra]|uniref:Uncharacterized protein n=1 Tax=Dovyalis caffra TaxID=77055 RepID=A0AAV1QTT7_9ROSI|nr:unnamed protein product [Dovyalis caffra]
MEGYKPNTSKVLSCVDDKDIDRANFICCALTEEEEEYGEEAEDKIKDVKKTPTRGLIPILTRSCFFGGKSFNIFFNQSSENPGTCELRQDKEGQVLGQPYPLWHSAHAGDLTQDGSSP